MPQVCWYFELHQPYRLRPYSIFELGRKPAYFQAKPDLNKQVFRRVSTKSYLPMLKQLKKLLKKHPDFSFTLSMSGIWVEQALAWQPQLIRLIQDMIKSDRVEILAETYYHSLASLYSPTEFNCQVQAHTQLMTELFRVKPTVFRNTELIYSNEVAAQVTQLGFQGMLTEAVDRYLHGRPRTQVFGSVTKSKTLRPLPLLLKHAQLSDDIAFRFSDRQWSHYPLHPATYVQWLQQYHPDELINLFMDFETFGEHQWADTGIFEFFSQIIASSLEHQTPFVRPSQVFSTLAPTQIKDLPVYDVPQPISWADVDRDLTAWTGNVLQTDTLKKIYGLERKILKTGDAMLIDDWRKLQTSDHFYYMCTKWSADGDVHAYFSPYDSPYEAYNRFATVLADLMHRLSSHPKA